MTVILVTGLKVNNNVITFSLYVDCIWTHSYVNFSYTEFKRCFIQVVTCNSKARLQFYFCVLSGDVLIPCSKLALVDEKSIHSSIVSQ